MFYLDSQRTTTRRDSSLITNRKNKDFDDISLYLGQPPCLYNIESSTSVVPARPKGSVQKELVTLMFESMLDSIVESWETIMPEKQEESYLNLDISKVPSETFTLSTGKKKKASAKPSKTKRSRSKLTLTDTVQDSQIIWWSAPDEKAVIRFRNGNVYEGNISMKCMHGEGRLQWADGTVYLGHFKDNEICGKGFIQWKDDTWYEGEFMGNLRHGQGLYVNSRLQRSYTGGWNRGTKHGEGAIYYSKDFKNSYDGGWLQNERFGYGSREYCTSSGYKGEWERNIREGKGLMIWPNDDFYRGEWKNGVMSGHGIYIWEANYNNTMSVPSLKAYQGYWEKGQRNGQGVLSLGLGWGSYYKGDFVNNMKSGTGKFVTNNGLILQGKKMFVDDNLSSMSSNDSFYTENSKGPVEPHQFDICDSSVGLSYHVEQALRNFDKQQEIISSIVADYIENNKIGRNKDVSTQARVAFVKDEHREKEHEELEFFQDLMVFEEDALRKSLRCYETDLKNIYYKYATICNVEEIHFTPIMTRLYLWQLYYDCHIHEKGLTLCDIDSMFYQNPAWLARNPHDPFEKIYFWQFVHSLISVASKLYAKRTLPGPKPDTVLACAFRYFMEQDILPGCKQHRGRLVNGFGTFVPLKAAYTLYRALGEPHTVRQFLRAVRKAPHINYLSQPPITYPPDEYLPLGRNLYIFGDEMSFIVVEKLSIRVHQKILLCTLDCSPGGAVEEKINFSRCTPGLAT
ncbi:unnamed protein product [Arctia plantaginis]|uniref:Uncharacterized protein n=1 Tax=Arctia plantaginis TaxID=874455 RepID=A0A8S0ZF82_ARCPL|nr:unnamed protein product [Arctia plantaginis]